MQQVSSDCYPILIPGKSTDELIPYEDEAWVEPTDSSRLIGTKRCLMDEQLMDRHVSNVLEWWLGKREPRGVKVEHSGRCL